MRRVEAVRCVKRGECVRRGGTASQRNVRRAASAEQRAN